jgi:hypothetical protein
VTWFRPTAAGGRPPTRRSGIADSRRPDPRTATTRGPAWFAPILGATLLLCAVIAPPPPAIAAAPGDLVPGDVPAEPGTEVGPELPPGPPPPGPLDGAVELDARAAALVAIRPTDLGDGFALMDLLSGLFPAVVGAFDRARDSVGLYSFSRGELGERGLDPDALVLLSWGQIDADDWTERRASRRSASAPLVFARHRVVLKIGQSSGSSSTDEVKLDNAFAQALQKRGATVLRLPGVPGKKTRAPAWSKAIAGAAKRASVRVLARGPEGDLFTLRVRDGRAIIDWAEPWAGKSKPTDKLAPVLAKMLAPPHRRLSDELARPPRPLLASPDSSISIMLSPPGIAALAPRAACRDDWSASDGALLADAALLLRMHPFDWKLEIIWTLTPAGRTVFNGIAADDGLADGRAIVHNGLAAGALLVSSLDAVGGGGEGKAVPRDRLARGLAAIRGDGACGAASAIAGLARYWPQLARAVMDEALPLLAAAPSDARPRNAVVLLGEASPARPDWTEALTYFVSFPQEATAPLERALGKAGTKGERQTFGDRTPRFFDFRSGGKFEEAAMESLAGGHVGVALAPPGSGLGWYYRMPRKPARFGTQNHVGFLHINVARLLGKFAADADSGTQTAVKLAASQIGLLGGNLTQIDDTLHLDLVLSPP